MALLGKLKALLWNNRKEILSELYKRDRIASDLIYLQKREIRSLENKVTYFCKWHDPHNELSDPFTDLFILMMVQEDNGDIGLPHIGKLKEDGCWHSLYYDELKLGSPFKRTCDCRVIGWLPIPKFEGQ